MTLIRTSQYRSDGDERKRGETRSKSERMAGTGTGVSEQRAECEGVVRRTWREHSNILSLGARGTWKDEGHTGNGRVPKQANEKEGKK